jgi:hypothetical protein
MWSVCIRKLCQPRTEADGKPVTESNLSLRAFAQVAIVLYRYGVLRFLANSMPERGVRYACPRRSNGDGPGPSSSAADRRRCGEITGTDYTRWSSGSGEHPGTPATGRGVVKHEGLPSP